MTITKRYRLIEEYEDRHTPEFAAWVGLQKRLFAALLNDPSRVEQVCRRALLDASELDLSYLRKKFDVPEEDDLLIQSFNELPLSDAARWKESSRGEMFYEDSEFVRNRIQPYMTGCKLQNLDTGDEIESNSGEDDEDDAPLTIEQEQSVIHSIETFGTWSEDGDYSISDDILSEIVFTSIESENELPPDIKDFLQAYTVLRTVFTHVDPVTKEAQCTDEQLAKEGNEWINANPVFTKEDLYCLKISLRKKGFPKLQLHNLLQDMRGKTFYDLAKAFLSGQYAAPSSTVA
jgi:hypothetical protein